MKIKSFIIDYEAYKGCLPVCATKTEMMIKM